MLQLVKKHQIKPKLDQVFSLEQAVEAFDRMKEGRQFGKIVLVP